MKIKIAIQDSYIPDHYATALVDACEALNLDFECFGLVPFVNDISAITGDILHDKESLIIPFGSTKIIKLWLKNELLQNWKVFYDSVGFDFLAQIMYSKELSDKLLNVEKGFILDFPECVDDKFKRDLFVKPTNDLKLFNGQVLPAGKSLRNLFDEQTTNSDIYELREKVLFSSVKNIKEEYRCFVIGDKVHTCMYKYQGKVVKMETDFITKMNLIEYCTLYNPAGGKDPYVVDVALVEESNNSLVYKILEYNAFQCSGFYNIDAKQVLKHTVDYVKENYAG